MTDKSSDNAGKKVIVPVMAKNCFSARRLLLGAYFYGHAPDTPNYAPKNRGCTRQCVNVSKR